MQTNIKNILEELYALEPSLREKEDAIIRIIESMQKNRPIVEIDEEFKRELHAKVMSELRYRHAELGSVSSSGSGDPEINSGGQKHGWNWGWVFGGLSTALLATFVLLTYGNLLNTSDEGGMITTTLEKRKNVVSFAPSIASTRDNAFGSVALVPSNALGTQQAMSSVAPRGMGGGGGGNAESAKMATDMIFPVEFTHYTYFYTGTLPAFTGGLVYQKNPGSFSSADTASFLSDLSLEGINLGAFQNKVLSNFSFAEDKDLGYIINVDFQNGNVSLYQNWEKWPQIKCDRNGCEERPALTESDIPSDEEFIRMGDAFLAQYGIDRSLYGMPKIDGNWRIMYELAKANNQIGYIPDQYNISYPLLLDGKKLYEEYGGYKGLNLTVDVRTKKVVGMYGLEKQNLTSSLYTTPTDDETMKKLIKFGGRYETKPYEGQKTMELALGEPTLEYVHIFGEWKDGKSPEYYIPAYIFPVQNKPKDSYGPESIIIPAVKDFATFIPMPDVPMMPVDLVKPMMDTPTSTSSSAPASDGIPLEKK